MGSGRAVQIGHLRLNLGGIEMKIYRYEHPDGGGPYCSFYGYPRDMKVHFPIDTSYLYGCKSIEELYKYFKNH